MVNLDCLSATQGIVCDTELVPLRGESVHDLGRQASFHLQHVIAREDARHVDGCLQIHPMIEDGRDHPSLAQGLIVSAHNAEGENWFSLLGYHAWHNRMHRAFTGGERVWMARVKREGISPVLE